MKKGIHPQMQWISYVNPSGRLVNVMMTKRFTRLERCTISEQSLQMTRSIDQIAKFKQRYGQKEEGLEDK